MTRALDSRLKVSILGSSPSHTSAHCENGFRIMPTAPTSLRLRGFDKCDGQVPERIT